MMTDAVHIRQAHLSDAPACAAIKNAWIDATPWMPRVHPADDLERHYRDHVFTHRQVFVAEADRVTGFMALDGGEVTSLFVAASAQRTGIGTRLIDLAKARGGDLTLWTFVANEPARRFYDALGFVEKQRSDGDNEEGLPDIELVWRAA